MNITILGAGAFGLSLSKAFSKSNNKITIWSKLENEINNLKDKYLKYHFTTSLENAIYNSDIIIIAIPIQFFYETIETLKNIYQNQIILIATKGIDNIHLKFTYEIIECNIPNALYGILSGGTFAKDMIEEKPMGITLATTNQYVKEKTHLALQQNHFLKIDDSLDIVGVSICGAIKNVIAIGFGILEGASYCPSSKYLFITNAISEIKKLIILFGGNIDTIFSYAGIDDIMMTCTSYESRNYTLGMMIGKRNDKEMINQYKKETTIEGLETTKAIYSIIDSNNFPIIKSLYNILFKEEDINKLLKQ